MTLARIASAAISLLLYGSLYAQSHPEKYASTITAEDLKKHLVVIAGARMEGRETGTEGQRKAAAYIEAHFRALGLTPGNNSSYQQVYNLMGDTMISSLLKVGNMKFKEGTDYNMSARANTSRKMNANRIVFAGYGLDDSLYSDYRSIDVKDAIVVVATGAPKDIGTANGGIPLISSVNKKIEAAAAHGAKGVLLVNPRQPEINRQFAALDRKTAIYFPREGGEQDDLNSANISHRFFKTVFGDTFSISILKRLAGGDRFEDVDYKVVQEKITFNYKEWSNVKAKSSNVIAFIEGTDKKDEYVFLTAHYDHIGRQGNVINYGADDDGSGTVSVMEMAEAFEKAKEEGNGPRRTIVFMTVSGEEKGLWGSEYYSEHPLFPLDKTSVDLNTDMVGRTDPKRKNGNPLNYVYVIGDNKLSSDLKPISESINKKYTNLELDYKYNDPNDIERIYYRSDHYNFARKGVPVLFYFNGTHEDYHQPTDTVDKINFQLMEKRVHLIFHTAWEIANRDEMLKRDMSL